MSVTIKMPVEVRKQLLRHALQGATYPSSTGELIEVAESNYAADVAIDMLTDLGDSQYYSFLDVTQEVMYQRRNEEVNDDEDVDDDEEGEILSSDFDYLDIRKEYV